MRILPEESMAIAVDYQERLLPAMHNEKELLKNSRILFEGLKALTVPILVSRQYPKGLGDIIPALKTELQDCPVYDKTTFSCYDNPSIYAAVREFKRKYIIICGVEAHICVLQTIIDLQADDYQTIFVADCIASRQHLDWELAVKRATQEGSVITSYETILFELTRGSQAPAFKTVSNLVK
ncbi:MAG: isochorismatase family protein [Desulfarculales bacterium]|nr:isochorismatase family protein [Desulfarculales bacterium]